MRVISGAELRSVLHVRMLVERLRQGFRADGVVPADHRYAVPTYGHDDGVLAIAPAWRIGRTIGVRIAASFPDNANKDLSPQQGVYVLFDGQTGVLRAFLEVATLMRRRAAAASALAATYLARPDSERLLVIGAGALALEVIEAYTGLLPIKHVLVWNRTPQRARKLAARFHRPRFRIEAVDDLAGAVAGANIVACATAAAEPLLQGAWLQPGVHVDLLGSTDPATREADDDCLRRARVFVDVRASAPAGSGDLVGPLADHVIEVDDIAADLFELTRGERAGRRYYDQITVFKAIGSPLEDLAAAELAQEMVLHHDTLR